MPIILAGLSLVALIWGCIVIQRWGSLGLGLLTLLAGICFGAPFFRVGSLTSDRVLVVVLAATYVFSGAFLQHVSQQCPQRSKLFTPKPIHALDWWGVAFLVWLLLCTLTHDWRIDDAQPLKHYLFYYALPGVVYWAARETSMDEANARKLLIVGACFGIYVAITAIAEWRGWYTLVWPRYIASEAFPEFFGRGRGPLLNPVGNGVLLCLGIAATALSWLHADRRHKHAFALALPALLLGVFATLTRCVWLAGMTTAVVLLFTIVPRVYRGRIAMLGVVLLSSVLVANHERLNHFKRDRDVSAAEMSKSAGLRPMLAKVAWGMFRDYPIAGVGLGQYRKASPAYHERETDFARPFVQHNCVLSVLVETGIVGVGLYAGLLIGWLQAAWRLWRQSATPLVLRHLGVLFIAIVSSYGVQGMFQDVTIIPMVHMVLAYFGGLTIGLDRSATVAHVEGLAPFTTTVAMSGRSPVPHRWSPS